MLMSSQAYQLSDARGRNSTTVKGVMALSRVEWISDKVIWIIRVPELLIHGSTRAQLDLDGSSQQVDARYIIVLSHDEMNSPCY